MRKIHSTLAWPTTSCPPTPKTATGRKGGGTTRRRRRRRRRWGGRERKGGVGRRRKLVPPLLLSTLSGPFLSALGDELNGEGARGARWNGELPSSARPPSAALLVRGSLHHVVRCREVRRIGRGEKGGRSSLQQTVFAWLLGWLVGCIVTLGHTLHLKRLQVFRGYFTIVQ